MNLNSSQQYLSAREKKMMEEEKDREFIEKIKEERRSRIYYDNIDTPMGESEESEDEDLKRFIRTLNNISPARDIPGAQVSSQTDTDNYSSYCLTPSLQSNYSSYCITPSPQSPRLTPPHTTCKYPHRQVISHNIKK